VHLPYAVTIQEAAIAHHKAALEICQLTVATAKTGNKKLTPALFWTILLPENAANRKKR
jgi:hypothetical protein